MTKIAQGQIWWAEASDKRRPVLVVTRSDAISVLNWLIVAPVTSTIRGIPTEISLGDQEGLSRDCVASFDSLQPIRREFLSGLAGALGLRRREICRALAALGDC